MTSSTPPLMAHWGPKGPARADRKVRGLPVPSRLRTGVREARAAERANDERKREENPPGGETPAVPTDRPGTEGMGDGINGGDEETGERETVIGHTRTGQRRIGMKRRESVVIGRKVGTNRRETGEEKLIGRRGWKIEAG